MLLRIRSDRDTLETSLWKHRAVKAVRDMNKVEYDRAKYTDPCVNDVRISVTHFVSNITTQQSAVCSET
jgi:hypothetical protein